MRWTFTVKAYDSPPRTPPQTCFLELPDATADNDAVDLITDFAANSNGKLMSISKQVWADSDQSVPSTALLTANTGSDRTEVTMVNKTVTPNVVSRVSIPLLKRNVTDAALITALQTLDLRASDGVLEIGELVKITRHKVTPGAII